MDTILFNFHDLIMVLTAFECLLFSALLLLTNKQGSTSALLLTGFLVCHFFIPVHELIFWGRQFRIWVLDISPNLFFWGSYAYFLDGVLLYLFFRSMIYKRFRLKLNDLYHLIPVALYLVGMILIFYSKDHDLKVQLVKTQSIAYSAPYLYFEAAGRLLRLVYALACVQLMVSYTRQLKAEYANLRSAELLWLKIMLGSFVILFGWDLVLLIIKLSELIQMKDPAFDADILRFFGIGSYYLNLIVITTLIFLRFTSLTKVASVSEATQAESIDDKVRTVDESFTAKLEQVIVNERFYADPDISLGRLAEKMNIPPQKVTVLIKDKYQLNFYEFVNGYRINEAKRLLVDPKRAHQTIMDIYLDVGFNSKSVFNTYFKRSVGVTPSRFREQHFATVAPPST